MKVDKVTREMLRSIRPGETGTYQLPNAAACDSAKVLAYQLNRIDGSKYSATTDYNSNTVKITRRHDNDQA